MTEMMMKPDEGLADRLHDVRYSAAAGHVKALAHYDAVERSPLQRAAAGELAMSAPRARRLRIAWRDTIASYTAGISDDTLLADLEAWIERHRSGGIAAMAGHIGELLAETAAVTRAEPGAVWILRALHASPRLVHVRLESHRHVTDRLADACAAHLAAPDRQPLWSRLRLAVELGFAADEMLYEEDRVVRAAVLADVAAMLRFAMLDLTSSPPPGGGQ